MSRYLTLFANNTLTYKTLLVGVGTGARTAISARRITIMTDGVSQFMEFGTSTVVASTASCVIPANSVVDFNVTTGTHVAFVTASAQGYVTIIDAD